MMDELFSDGQSTDGAKLEIQFVLHCSAAETNFHFWELLVKYLTVVQSIQYVLYSHFSPKQFLQIRACAI